MEATPPGFPLRLVSFEAIREWECFGADESEKQSPIRQAQGRQE